MVMAPRTLRNYYRIIDRILRIDWWCRLLTRTSLASYELFGHLRPYTAFLILQNRVSTLGVFRYGAISVF